MILMTEHPERLMNVEVLYLGPDLEPYQVKRMRHQDGMIITFEKVPDLETAETLREHLVHVHLKDAVPLEDGEYYLFQIEGIRVVTEDGEELGRLTGLIETGANDVYIVTSGEGKEILLPAIPDVILNVDVPGGIMTVRLLEGLR
jgi:16S rRNA processing protein RimM